MKKLIVIVCAVSWAFILYVYFGCNLNQTQTQTQTQIQNELNSFCVKRDSLHEKWMKTENNAYGLEKRLQIDKEAMEVEKKIDSLQQLLLKE